MPVDSRPLTRLLEALEPRDVPAAAPWLVEPFQRGPAAGLPAGWARSTGPTGFHVDTAGGLGDRGELASTAAGRAWLTTAYAADVEASAAVYLGSPARVGLFVRGQNLTTAAPSYYAVRVTRGAAVELVRLDHGRETVLGRVTSAAALADKWVTVTVRAAGDAVRAELYRGDTNQFLAADGTWTRRPAAAVAATDAAVRGPGQVGFARDAAAGAVAVDSLRVGPADAGDPVPLVEERFARGAAAGLPAGWREWAAGPVTARTAADETLRLDAPAGTAARVWPDRALPADVQVSSSVYVDGRGPAGVFARGSNPAGVKPTYYAVEIRAGLKLDLVKVVDGVRSTIASGASRDYLSGLWVQQSLVLNGDQLRVQLFRSDTGQYLHPDGTWGLAPAFAVTARDAAIKAGGTAGLTRGAGAAGQMVFDNVIVTTSPDRYARPGPIPTEADKPTTPTPPADTAPGPVRPTPPPAAPPQPASAGNPNRPAVPRHYAHIRLANLAYYGTPLDQPADQKLLRQSVDLVIPNLTYLDAINAASPGTPQLVYTNVSNIYLGLVTDWADYADARRLDREAAYYHVTAATKYDGFSASAVPVDRFWGVYQTDAGGAVTADLTRDAAHTGNSVAFAENGRAVAFGYVEKFREINVDLASPAGAGWAGMLEYPTAVDGRGRPTRWGALKPLADTTGGFKRDGKITFDPPRDWAAVTLGDSARLFYVRVRTTGAGPVPKANTVLGADYSAGAVTPAFDSSADRDRDGYLSDAEYARRKPGMDARFMYQSRLTYPSYGPMRFATNVSDPGFRAWAADYHARFLAATPQADGFFVDNSVGKLAVDPDRIAETLDGYAADYGSLLGAINKRLAASGKWLIANTAGGNASADPILRNGVSYLEEFALRPLSANHVQFDDLQATLQYRRQISGGRAYEILDSLPTGGVDATDPRLELSTLAMYYTLADPQLSFLMMNGGNEPASSWTRHYTKAIEYDVGRPAGDAAVVATGADPANRSLTYKVYGRPYTNALVLYKPVSYTRGVSGGTGTDTATAYALDGLYRPVKADGSLGAATRSVSLRNGEGVVLARV